ncbi:MAG: response regulator [Deltaproteobacteria bacterium]|nr:response regulator [Deltaproteobacteria bacterium]
MSIPAAVLRSEGYTDMAGELVLVIDDSPTITKVVQLVLTKAGYQVATAPDGEAGLAAVRSQRPDLILLDFVMPRMNGYQFCRELVADPKLRDIPVVLMSAKGDQVGERFVKVMGIVDYITKPFSPEAITAVVQHTIGKYGPAGGGEEDNPSLVTGEDLAATDDADRVHARASALNTLRDQLSEVVSARIGALFQLAETSHDPDAKIATDAAAIREAARTSLDDAALQKIMSALDLGLFGESTPGLRGDLRVVPLAEVLQLLDVQEQSGILTVERSGARVDIYFRRGRVDQAVAEGVPEEFLLGRFVLDAELMQRGDFEAFLESRANKSGANQRLIGQQLVKLGLVAELDLKACLTRQSSELIYEILRWRHGRFRFAAGLELPPSVIDAALGLDVEAVLMEGYRRVDEWHLIERAIDNFDVVFLRNEDSVAQMGRGRLTREELAVLELVNGKNTVKDIIRKSRMGSFEVSKMLYRLLSIKLVRRRVLPVAV